MRRRRDAQAILIGSKSIDQSPPGICLRGHIVVFFTRSTVVLQIRRVNSSVPSLTPYVSRTVPMSFCGLRRVIQL